MPEPTPTDVVERLAERLAEPGAVVLIDGRSGSGKSALADLVLTRARTLEPSVRLVAMEDLYPGWDGLAEAARAVVDDLLAPLASGRTGRWKQYDWHAGRTGPVHEVTPGPPLLVEGVGALTRRSAPLATWRVWLEVPDDVRRERALARDGDTYAPHWERWAEQESAVIARHDPADLADQVLTRAELNRLGLD